MFRLAIISFIALRVTMCPLFCAVSNGDACVFTEEIAVTCTCSAGHNEACQSDEVPAPLPIDSPCDCPVPCDTGCVCQVAFEFSGRTTAACIELSLDFLPVCFDTADVTEIIASQCKEHPHRLDLLSGRSIRLVFASLLI
ncbi:hypothetical protein Pr1d_32020 [Bythopirellula goksoeyrii]|uniref:EGF-like domain-containing protein n=1 Tax=Bythopirellula goksoeyrii TaxID=1400387 RepID=A0A5B9QG44_9BACT|nr:hypothetical protein Pr1d_32020 [Bythopirellula goksoeyrii]